jgi:hypothetical protein
MSWKIAWVPVQGEELGYARISSHASYSAHTSNEDESKSRGRKAVCVMGSRADEEGLKSRRASDGASEGVLDPRDMGIYVSAVYSYIYLWSCPSEVRLAISGQALPDGRAGCEVGQSNIAVTKESASGRVPRLR